MWPTQIWWFWVSTKDFFIKLAIEGVPERLRGPVEGERSVSLPGAHIIVITTRFFRAALTLPPPPPESVVHANAYKALHGEACTRTGRCLEKKRHRWFRSI